MSGQGFVGRNSDGEHGVSVLTDNEFSLVRSEGYPSNAKIYFMEKGIKIGSAGISFGETPLINSIKVEPRGNGYGAIFMDLIEAYFRELGHKESCADAWGPIVSFFVKQGYAVSERDPPAYLMTKGLF